MLEESGVDSERLELEITESALMKNPEEAGSILRSLRELGVKVSIDDFGTGYSSLSYLKRFPVSILKIDQSFVREIVNSSDDQAIAEAVIALAKGMNLMVVAEGVETEAQLKILKVLECDKVQGYFFSRPISPDAIASFVEAGIETHWQSPHELPSFWITIAPWWNWAACARKYPSPLSMASMWAITSSCTSAMRSAGSTRMRRP
jgi:EAL domain-containing protein (putative c-di-GMP-specific phosphodiesterase class I)